MTDLLVPRTITDTPRGYRREGRVIYCYSLENYDDRGYQRKYCIGQLMMEMHLPSEAHARMLMEDLYYGEYDGA